MKLTRYENEMLDGRHSEAKRLAMSGLVQLGEAVDAPDMVEIGYAHVHPGMALYAKDVELMEDLANLGMKMAVPASANVINADLENWQQTGAPEALVRLQARVISVHQRMECGSALSCTPYWAGHWPTWNTHMTSLESGVTIFCNSVLGAKSNRDGFFALYAGATGRYPRFGYHLDENRIGSLLVHVDAPLENTGDFSALGYHVGKIVGSGVPVFTGFSQRPSLDDMDALGATLATAGGVTLFIVPGVTPPYASVGQAFGGRKPKAEITVTIKDLAAIYDSFGDGSETFDMVHLGCPHASYEEMKAYANLLRGRKVHGNVDLWVTTSRAIRDRARDSGFVAAIEETGGKVIADTCPIECHFIRTGSPDPSLGVVPSGIKAMVVDSAKQAKYARDMIFCKTLFTSPEFAVESAVTGRFVRRYGART